MLLEQETLLVALSCDVIDSSFPSSLCSSRLPLGRVKNGPKRRNIFLENISFVTYLSMTSQTDGQMDKKMFILNLHKYDPYDY